ncbi:hypothetical protein BGZ96_004544, partial [Linnemannia gamsii]
SFQYTVKAGGSLPLTFKLQLRKAGQTANTIVSNLEKFLKAGATGTFDNMVILWTPKVSLATMSGFLYPDFGSRIVYSNTKIPLKVGSDLPMIKEWFYREFNITTTPTSLLPPPETTVTLPTTTTPPLVPSDTPTPTTPTTVKPTVEPTVEPPTAEPTVTPTAAPAA